MRAAIPAIFGILLAGCGGLLAPKQPVTPMTEQAKVEEVLRQYSEMLLAMNHAGIAGLFDPVEGEVVNPGQPAIRGQAAIERFLRGFSDYRVLEYKTGNVRTVVDGEKATVSASYEQKVRIPDGTVVEPKGWIDAELRRDPRSGVWFIRRMGTRQ